MLTQQLVIKLKTLIHISPTTFNYDIRCIALHEICSLASNRKSTRMAHLNDIVIKVKGSHENLTLSLEENVGMVAFLCEICHFQKLTRKLVCPAQKTWLGLPFLKRRKEKEEMGRSYLITASCLCVSVLIFSTLDIRGRQRRKH